MGLSQNQTAALIRADERTIMNIETYRANTTMEILYPLIRTLLIDARDSIILRCARKPFTSSTPSTDWQLQWRSWGLDFGLRSCPFWPLISKRHQNRRKKACLPLIGKQALRLPSGSFAYCHFQLYDIYEGFLFTFRTEKREVDHYGSSYTSVRVLLLQIGQGPIEKYSLHFAFPFPFRSAFNVWL